MTLSEATGLLGLIRSVLLDRPAVKILIRAVDHAQPGPDLLFSFVGPWLHVEVHATGRIPVRIMKVGIELDDGQVIDTTSGTRLDVTLTRPESIHRAISLADLRAAVRAAGSARRLARIRVEASPDHVFGRKLPNAWRAFPDQDPPLTPGEAEGFLIGWV